ncbi:hypothetical protein ASG49_09205 [Marmoricola sp. Leaf446]|uniref:hypothetical protein n=1 Tax=Marmoricola sp. Leaf446 TaxID=1736379 RepID=UPI0006F68A75|nr:hypothetical protein [Marmoricola sp. Leaf446]KQT92130.1 hypothetical protein ASG49_09205 [Marmoricola sp. Leaf446]
MPHRSTRNRTRGRARSRTRPGLLALVTAALLLGTGCEAPLQPESRRETAATPSPTASESASDSPGRASPSAPPSIEVPEGLEQDARDRVRRQAERRARSGPVLGGDISWPQCPRGLGIPERRTLGLPLPPPEAEYVVIGLTNGPSFTANPCLADQVGWARQRGLPTSAYVVLSGPYADTLARFGGRGPFDAGTEAGRLANLGHAQARYALGVMRRAGLETPFVWLDVEPVPAFEWSDDPAANAQVVRGAARAWTDAGFGIGVYSTASLWAGVVGDLELGLPEWRAAGETSRAEALRRCGPASRIQGGPAVMGQWLQDSRDHDVTCPGAAADLGRYFHDPGVR